MDSPLSDIDVDEVIADSEDEGLKAFAKDRDKVSMSKSGLLPNIDTLEPVPPSIPNDQIDYFAGFQDDIFLPIPSIAERAKTRKRKPKEKLPQDVLELTDDDEFALKPLPSKPKKKTKEKPTKDLADSHQATDSDSISAPQNSGVENAPLINARNKVRPRPVKRTPLPPQTPQHDRTSQATLPVPTSPFHPPPNHFTVNSSRYDIPPSDPPLTSSLGPDKDTRLPPIEFLPPPDDTDTPLPSSQPGGNVDELQVSNRRDQLDDDYGAVLPPPPPTFFTGSSSLPPPAVPTPHLPPPPPVDVVDLTDIPSTALAPSIGAPDPSTGSKAKKPRKPRKKKGESGDADPGTAEAPQAGSHKKKGKVRTNQVTVEIPLPPPAVADLEDALPTAKKRKRKLVLDDPMEEDELNIRPGQLDPITEVPAERPSQSLENKDLPVQESLDNFDYNDTIEKPSKADKRKGKKRKVIEDSDKNPPLTAVSRKKKKIPQPSEVEGLEDGFDEGLTVPPKRTSKKGRKGGEEPDKDDNIDPTRAAKAGKGKRRMIIASDDEDDGNGDPIVEDPQAPFPEPEEHQKESGKLSTEGDAAKVADHLQDDRNILRATKARDSPPDGDTELAPQQRHETPSMGKYPSLASRYTIAPKSQTSGMSELIRRASSHVNSPFVTPSRRGSPLARSVYSPLLKSSRRSLSRIAPLHPNRRTPPPPKPPPPPKKKSKKEQELEERWEEEIIEEIGGVTEWLALSEAEKKDLKRMKRDREMGYCED
ncbi:hypothetical protein D9756_003084 [Leucocoprinus leucothites]|uniref:Uncharacterized protein n=1 Tax=Leucocoprinus leucothites TaxID=201217 RepID=A0A8H5LJK2_9AGAR|nr:hypothetical protein D9756_003084 [Leucoagaricus leucothites]